MDAVHVPKSGAVGSSCRPRHHEALEVRRDHAVELAQLLGVQEVLVGHVQIDRRARVRARGPGPHAQALVKVLDVERMTPEGVIRGRCRSGPPS